MNAHRTAKQLRLESAAKAKNLPTETKRKFWKAMMEDGKNLGEARDIAGIDDVMVAAELVIQCHTQVAVPMAVSDIT